MYRVLLLLHSWNRWLVILGLIGSLLALLATRLTAKPGRELTSRLRIFTLSAFDLQVLMGICLYFLSPLTPKSLAALSNSMGVTQLRFFALEHQFSMVFAFFALHLASALAKRAPTAQLHNRRWLVGVLVGAVLITVGIPWPSLPYGRPLFRGMGNHPAARPSR